MSIDAIRYKSYNNVIDTLKCIGEKHLNIKTVTSGDIWTIDLEKNTLFPLFHINPVNVTVGLHQRTFNYQLFFMDLVEPDSSNEQEVLSDCLEIMNDIIAIYKHGEILYKFNDEAGEEDRYFINDDFTIEPFTEEYDNAVTGWIMSFAITVENELNTCNIPIDNSTICSK